MQIYKNPLFVVGLVCRISIFETMVHPTDRGAPLSFWNFCWPGYPPPAFITAPLLVCPLGHLLVTLCNEIFITPHCAGQLLKVCLGEGVTNAW